MAADGGKKKGGKGLEVEGYPVEGLSIGGQETCVIFPTLRMAFDIGRCPQRAVSQEYLFISHGHMDHIVIPPAIRLSFLRPRRFWEWSIELDRS